MTSTTFRSNDGLVVASRGKSDVGFVLLLTLAVVFGPILALDAIAFATGMERSAPEKSAPTRTVDAAVTGTAG